MSRPRAHNYVDLSNLNEQEKKSLGELIMAELLAKGGHERLNISQYCFDKQRKFINDIHRFKTAVCSRRSGKTVACAAHLVSTALDNPRSVNLYITLSRSNAKRIVWPELLDINRRFILGGKVNETELSITFRNKSIIYCSGAKDSTEIEKFRGLAIKLCYIDEAQSFKTYIEQLVDDVISPALFDHNGHLCLIGTPGPVPIGYFHKCATSKYWGHHHWTMFDNPYLEKKSGKTVDALVDEECERKGVTRDNATIQRECFGKWVVDSNSLVFRYDENKNSYSSVDLPLDGRQSVIGVDVGFDDADAISVIQWHPKHVRSYLVEEKIKAKQGITELVAQVEELIAKYDPIKIVMDTGGLGKKIAEEIRRRYQIPIMAAEKTRKYEYIELLNDAMRSGKFYAKKDSQFAQDCFMVEWDKESPTPKISDSFHSDINDAVLYAFRESLHWLSEPEEPVIKPGTTEWMAMQEAKMMEQAEEELIKRKSVDIMDNFLDDTGL